MVRYGYILWLCGFSMKEISTHPPPEATDRGSTAWPAGEIPFDVPYQQLHLQDMFHSNLNCIDDFLIMSYRFSIQYILFNGKF